MTQDEFVNEVCLIVGQDNEFIRRFAEAEFAKGTSRRWTAILIAKNMAGPGGLNEVRFMAERMGFDPSLV